MLKQIFTKKKGENIHELIFFIALSLFVIGLPASRTLVTVSQILMGLNWVLEFRYRQQINRFLACRPAVIMTSIYLVYLTGMLWTNDLYNGFGNELINKLPFFTLPFFITSYRSPDKDRVNILPFLFFASVIVVSILGTVNYYSSYNPDPRDFSPFIVHIHLSTMVVLSIFWLPWSVRRLTSDKRWYIISLAFSAWLVFFLFMLSSLTGNICFAAVIIFIAMDRSLLRSASVVSTLRFIFFAIGITSGVALMIYLAKPLLLKIEYEGGNLMEMTEYGNRYHHSTEQEVRENGYLVYVYIADEELKSAWELRSQIPYDSLDKNQNEIRYTVYRFLTSKGLRKDKTGLDSVDDNEINAIENGVPNYLYLRWPNAFIRIHQTLWEIQQYMITGDPTGHTFTQRIELWKASWVAVQQHPLLGWGTGDVFEAVEFGLRQLNSKLDNYKMKPHNQLLTLLLNVGIIGTLIILGLFIFFIHKSKPHRYYPMKIALLVFFVSAFSVMPFDNQMSLSFLMFVSLYFGLLYKPES